MECLAWSVWCEVFGVECLLRTVWRGVFCVVFLVWRLVLSFSWDCLMWRVWWGVYGVDFLWAVFGDKILVWGICKEFLGGVFGGECFIRNVWCGVLWSSVWCGMSVNLNLYDWPPPAAAAPPHWHTGGPVSDNPNIQIKMRSPSYERKLIGINC